MMAAMGEAKRYRGYHDLGGAPAGAIDRANHDYTLSEKRVDALFVLLGDAKRRLLAVDEHRRAIEALGADAYERLGYYERWIAALANLLVEKGVLSRDEIAARIAEIRARGGAP